MDRGRCEVCGESANVHLCEIRDHQKVEHHFCQVHAGTSQVPGIDVAIFIQQAISFCQMMLPADKRSRQHVAAEIRRLTERAIGDMLEDAKAFGLSGDQAPT
jgi:protein-arginine kinase activator protein McsA